MANSKKTKGKKTKGVAARERRQQRARTSKEEKRPRKKGEPEDMVAEGRYNRTGLGTAPVQGPRALEASEGWEPPVADPSDTRASYAREAEPIGTVPPPTSLKGIYETAKGALIEGEKPTVLIDKLGERMAFERTGVRLYEALIGRVDALGSFEGGPSLEQLRRFRDQEAQHMALLKECLESVGADPTAVTPSADLAGVESEGVGKVLGDPRTTVPQCLHAILVAELVDRDGWELLIDLADLLGHDEMASGFREAHAEEEEHLRQVRGWVASHVSATAKKSA